MSFKTIFKQKKKMYTTHHQKLVGRGVVQVGNTKHVILQMGNSQKSFTLGEILTIISRIINLVTLENKASNLL